MGGDFNIDYSKTKRENTKKLKHLSSKHSLVQYIQNPTRPMNSDSIIDLILSNCKYIDNSGILTWNVSDHTPVYINIKKHKNSFPTTEFTGRSYKNFRQNSFLDKIRQKDWDIFYNSENVDTQWEILYNNIIRILDDMIPVRTFKFAKSKPAWLVGEVLELMKDRDRALKKATRTKKKDDKIYARQIRNKTNILIRNAKNNFVKEKLNNYSDNPKKFWKQIKSVMPTTGLNSPIILLDDQGSKLNNLVAANLINDYFTNIGSVLANKIRANLSNLPPRILQNLNIENSLGLVIPTQAEVMGWVKKIQIFKSSGIPLIATRIWKTLFLQEPNLLYKMIVTIFNTCIFPNVWKTATIVPIPKVAKIKGPEDLRPISLLPIPGKLLEHLIYSQLDTFLEQNNLLTEFQNGFRTKRSTIQTIFNFTTDIIQIYNDGNDTIAIYIDFKKAFDTVNHQKLIDKFKICEQPRGKGTPVYRDSVS